MYFRYIVLTENTGMSNQELREDVYETLLDNGFAGTADGGWFLDYPSDGFAIGGGFNDFFNENAKCIDDLDNYYGNDDSAILVTKEIWEKIKDLKDSFNPRDIREGNCIGDLESEEITPENVISKKMAVIIEGHF